MDNGLPELLSDSTRPESEETNDQQVYFVPYRWWKDANETATNGESGGTKGVLYTVAQGSSYAGPMKYINNIFNSDLAFNLRREENDSSEVSVSGRDFALVPGEMWLKALKWHSDNRASAKGDKSFSASEDDMSDVYPLQLRLSMIREVNTLGVKISKKDNSSELFRRACKIFSMDSEVLHIWDFSGQTSLYFMNDKNTSPKDRQRQFDEDILLELQVYGLSDSIKCKEGKKENASVHSNGLLVNGCTGKSSSSLFGKSGECGPLGLTGLINLGNTCFMNSALQCLAHTPKLVDYFLGDYDREINHDNPLGMNGQIALGFGELLRKLWAPGSNAVAPRTFKSKLAQFAPQFSGFNQHDSQELLAFLLDGLHEDLNRVKSKPYVEAKDGDGRPDDDVADEYWRNHVARNDSIIVDVCQGQYKSTLVCPDCRKVSVTFDPFMYLSLPLPSISTRTMTLIVVSTDGSLPPSPYTVSVPKQGKSEDLIQAISSACSLGLDETLLVAEVYNNRIIRCLDETADSLSLLRDGDRLVAYRLPKDENASLAVFLHQQAEGQYIHGRAHSSWKTFGIPLVGIVRDSVNGSAIQDLYLKLLAPFRTQTDSTVSETSDSTAIKEGSGMEDCTISTANGEVNQPTEDEAKPQPVSGLQFYLTDEKGATKGCQILMNEPLPVTDMPKRFNVLVSWTEKEIRQYDTILLSTLPEIFKSGFLTKRPQESVSLFNCLEAFLKEEPLGPEDMWFCPRCKQHRQASKKLDLWRLPEILVIHLKRFSYTRFMKNKLETYVDFPVDNLDLSAYVSYKNGQSCHRYMLYAISNHYGSMGGGHYTAFIHHGGDQWYDFDDSHVRAISQERIKTSAAYVLFYRRVVEV